MPQIADDEDVFLTRPWHQPGARVDGLPRGMLRPTEASLLFHLARRYFRGYGDIIDAGSFLGASSFSLASGLELNERISSKSGRIHAYDLFEVWRELDTTYEFVASELGSKPNEGNVIQLACEGENLHEPIVLVERRAVVEDQAAVATLW